MKLPQGIEPIISDAKESLFADILQPGEILANQYKILLSIKKSPCVFSYACEDLNTGETVIIYAVPDVICSNGELKLQIEQLINDLALLKSKSIFTKYELVNLPQEMLVVAKYPIGKSISQWRESHDIGSEDNRMLLKHLLLDAASALDCLHSRGMIHGCVIPENMLVTNDNSLILLNTGIIPLLMQQEKKRHKQLGNRDCLEGISINCRIFPESTLKEALARDILL